MRSRKVQFMVLAAGVAVLLLLSGLAKADPLYFQGFETPGWTQGGFTDWNDYGGTIVQAASGTNAVTSSDGSYHAIVTPNAYGDGVFMRFGGYNYGAGTGVPTVFREYVTRLNIYLDVNAGLANNTNFDWDSAICNSSGGFLADFIFSAGFYNDNDGSPGSGTNRFIVSSSNNSQPTSAYPKNPGRDPYAISATGWYTFEHHFYDLDGYLAADMSIYDASSALLHTWTLTPNLLITGVGGNRYGWIDYDRINGLAIDNASLELVPEPFSMVMLGCLGGGMALARRLRRKAA